MSWDIEGFRRKLEDQHDFPGMYTFKFIVPSERVADVEALTSKGNLSLKPSSKGTYTSVTIRMHAGHAQEVIKVYESAATIHGCIAL